MVGRKLFLLKKQPAIIEETILVQTPNLREVRHIVLKKSREYGYVALVEIVRFSIKSSRVLKSVYKETKNKIGQIKRKYILRKEKEEVEQKEKEVSGFLKKISEYKHKIRKIKHQILKEEKENL